MESTLPPNGDTASPTMMATPSTQNKNGLTNFFTTQWKTMLGVVGGAVLLGGASYWAFTTYFIPPKMLLKEAAENFNVDSIKIGFNASAENVDINGSIIAHEKELSQINMSLSMLEEGIKHDFDLNMIVDEKDFYFQMNYSLMQQILAELSQEMPQITSMNTYMLLKPVITGQSWLHAAIPEEEMAKTDTSDDKYEKEWKTFGEKLEKAIVVKDFKRNEKVDGEKYSVVSLGVDKEKLLEAIDALKDLDISADIADVNTMKKSIEDLGELKETLMVVYIDSSKHVRMVDLYAPQGSSESIQEVIDQEAATTSPLLAQFSQITSFFQPDKNAKEGEPVKFMTMTFDDYGSAERVEKPSPLVEWENVLMYAQTELMPLFYQYMMLQQGGGAAAPANMMYPPQGGTQMYPGTVPGNAGSTAPAYPGMY